MTHCVLTNLNAWARDTVLATQPVRVVGNRIYPDGSTVPFETSEYDLIAKVEFIRSGGGPFDSWTLHRYILPDGTVFEEYFQEWGGDAAGDLVRFVALKDASGQVVPASLWSQKEIDEILR